MSTQYKQSPYQSNTGEELPRLQLATAASTAPVVADNFMRSTPSPVGQISTQREIDWTKLTSTTPHVSLQSVLLPADPLADIDGSMLQDVLTDLSAQLQ